MKPYKENLRNTCGPCSFINLVGIKGSIVKERKLMKTGRIKPFHGSLYNSFLVWADKFGYDLEAYTFSRKINKRMIKLMVRYEKIPKSKVKDYTKKVKDLSLKRDKKYKDKIHFLENPIKKLNSLLDKGKKVAVLVSSCYMKWREPVPHWIVIYKKKKEIYYIMDSARKGVSKLSKRELLHSLKLNKKVGFYPQFVVLK